MEGALAMVHGTLPPANLYNAVADTTQIVHRHIPDAHESQGHTYGRSMVFCHYAAESTVPLGLATKLATEIDALRDAKYVPEDVIYNSTMDVRGDLEVVLRYRTSSSPASDDALALALASRPQLLATTGGSTSARQPARKRAYDLQMDEFEAITARELAPVGVGTAGAGASETQQTKQRRLVDRVSALTGMLSWKGGKALQAEILELSERTRIIFDGCGVPRRYAHRLNDLINTLHVHVSEALRKRPSVRLAADVNPLEHDASKGCQCVRLEFQGPVSVSLLRLSANLRALDDDTLYRVLTCVHPGGISMAVISRHCIAHGPRSSELPETLARDAVLDAVQRAASTTRLAIASATPLPPPPPPPVSEPVAMSALPAPQSLVVTHAGRPVHTGDTY